MKFLTLDDARHFLVEIDQFDRALDPELKLEEFEPTPADMSEFIKRRNKVSPIIKDFRKSQTSRAAWRKSRYKYMKGIKGFHDSTRGKRFHRQLGRFLSTRDTRQKGYQRDTRESILEVSDTLKGISSLRTHLYIWLEYYRPVDEAVDAELVLDEVLPALARLEAALLSPDNAATVEDLDLLAALTEDKALLAELEVAYGRKVEIVDDTNPMEDTGCYLERLNILKDALKDAGGEVMEALFLSPIGVDGNEFFLAVEGKVFAYTSKSAGVAIDAIADEFCQRAAVSRTMALAWLRGACNEREVEDAEFETGGQKPDATVAPAVPATAMGTAQAPTVGGP
jgi:hypothetical protein